MTPKNSRGWHIPLWQAADAMGYPRLYPSTLLQCAGYTVRGGAMDITTFFAALDYMAGSRLWYHDRRGNAQIWPTVSAMYFAIHQLPFPGAGYWDVLWTTHWDPTYGGFWRVRQWRIEAPNTTRDLLTGAQYPWNAAPWSNDPQFYLAGFISKMAPSWFGDPWDNPI